MFSVCNTAYHIVNNVQLTELFLIFLSSLFACLLMALSCCVLIDRMLSEIIHKQYIYIFYTHDFR